MIFFIHVTDREDCISVIRKCQCSNNGMFSNENRI